MAFLYRHFLFLSSTHYSLLTYLLSETPRLRPVAAPSPPDLTILHVAET